MDFDRMIDRSQTLSHKWNSAALREHFGNDNLLPFWVADMDLPAPPDVIQQLVERAEHGIYGYEYKPDSFFEALTDWYKQRHNWIINPEQIEFSPSVMNTIAVLLNLYTDEGDGIIVQSPVFFEFRLVIRHNKRELIKNPLKLVNGKYLMDFDDLETKAADPRTKMMILCNPHNPVGRVWTREELQCVGEICHRHNILVISDEIHADILYDNHSFISFSSLSEEFARQSFTCISPAKTFNIAGMVDSMVLIPDNEYRAKFADFANRFQLNKINVFSNVAIEAAYRQASEWLDDLLAYLQENIDFIQQTLADKIPTVRLIAPEGTYLIWLDFRGLGLDAKALERFLADQAGLALNAGYWFGREGAGFARMNIACPRSMLEDAFTRLENAVHRL